jgi:hypothetical protein
MASPEDVNEKIRRIPQANLFHLSAQIFFMTRRRLAFAVLAGT